MGEDEDVLGLVCHGLWTVPVVQGVPRGASGFLPEGALEGADHSSGLECQSYGW